VLLFRDVEVLCRIEFGIMYLCLSWIVSEI